jgi:post-segregation antitoxin (ccd killing protein)
MNTIVRKIIIGVLVGALALAGLPLTSAYAAGPADPPVPQGTPDPARVDARLTRAFARQNRLLDRIGKLYENAGQGFPRIQQLLDKAKAQGLDVSAVQAALDAFKKALPGARSDYDQAKALADKHDGFDAGGNVTDATAARATVQGIHDALSQFRDALGGTGKALREAIQAFRQAHPRPGPTPATTPSGGA